MKYDVLKTYCNQCLLFTFTIFHNYYYLCLLLFINIDHSLTFRSTRKKWKSAKDKFQSHFSNRKHHKQTKKRILSILIHFNIISKFENWIIDTNILILCNYIETVFWKLIFDNYSHFEISTQLKKNNFARLKFFNHFSIFFK